MDQVRWNRIEALLQDALDLEADERLPFLRRACGGDDALLSELQSLLRNQAAGMFLETPAIAGVAAQFVSPPLTGKHVSHYRIEAQIGAGGMGDVYRARDESLQRTVALKALPPEFAADAARVNRLEHEAFAASRLNHPNIITIYEIAHSDEGHFIVTEYIEGKTLRALMTDPATGAARSLDVERALDIAIQVTAAVKAAHAAWIIHRDIKPENIMVRSDGLVKVLDFGIAKLHDQSDPPAPPDDRSAVAELTNPGAVLGTANYMSPEQARGLMLDGRTDLYSLGLVLREMLSGKRPAASSMHDLDGVPRALQRIVRRMLEPRREDRYSSAGELLDELARARQNLENRTARRMIGIGAFALIIAVAVAGVAAVLSVQETWDERVLRDGHAAAARQVIFSPDGRLLVSCGEDGRVIVWDFARRTRLVTLEQASLKVAFSPDGSLLAGGASNGTISIWETRTWKEVHVLRGHRTEVAALGFSVDGKLLASSAPGPDARMILWDLDRWEKADDWRLGVSHGSFVFSPDGRQVLTTTMDVVDLAARTVEPSDTSITTNWIAANAGVDHVASIDSTGTIALYRLREERSLVHRDLIASRRAHQDHGRSVAFSPDGSLLASAAENIQLWDGKTLKRVGRFDHPAIVWSVAFSPDGRWLVSAHGDGAVLIWDLAEWRLDGNLNEHADAVRAVAFHPDGQRAASAGDDRTVTIWDIPHGRKAAVFHEHQTRVTGVAFASHRDMLVSVDLDGVIVLRSSGQQEEPATFRTAWPSYTLAVSSDSRFLADTFGISEIDGPRRFPFPHGFFGTVYGVAFSNDGRLIAAVTDQGWVSVWDALSFQILDRVRASRNPQISVSFSADGEHLVTGDDAGIVRLWSTRPLREIAVVGRHEARVKSVAFSPDGETIASAGDDKMIALWDVAGRKLRTRVGSHSSPVYAVAFSPDGRRLLSGEHDHSVRVYTRHRDVWGMRLD